MNSTERSKVFRKKKLAAGEKEVRGLFAKEEIHKPVKENAKKFINQLGANKGKTNEDLK